MDRPDSRFRIGPGVTRAHRTQPHERRPGEPLHRPLAIFALDPDLSKRAGATPVVSVAYEPLEPGPAGALFEVDGFDAATKQRYRPLDLNDPALLLGQGRRPSSSDPLFHAQMVYAVASLTYAAFRRALGRSLAWGFESSGPGSVRLRLRTHAGEMKNAYYDQDDGSIAFGYFRGDEDVPGRLPKGLVFTALSHDIIAHEVTHAILDGLRAEFVVPTNPDVLAFHEGVADLVAILLHFSYAPLLDAALEEAEGALSNAELLGGLARQFGHATGEGGPLRSAIDLDATRVYDPALGVHELGSILVTAVFDAMVSVFRRKVRRYEVLVGGRPDVRSSDAYRALLVREAAGLAGQFLDICIRAIDYCPPVDLEFGDYLRAVITADRELVPDDPWGYREAWIDAFRKRRVFPRDIDTLDEDSLVWRPPERSVGVIEELGFGRLEFDGDPARPASVDELVRQAAALGRVVTRPDVLPLFGLARPGDAALAGDEVDRPVVQSVRSSRRMGPDGEIVFDLVAEVTQVRRVRPTAATGGFEFLGGATVVIDPSGCVRYAIRKSITNRARLERTRDFVFSERGLPLWRQSGGQAVPDRQPFRVVHDRSRVNAVAMRPGA